MNDTPDIIVPANWEQLWSGEAVAFLKPLLRSIGYAFDERDHDAFFQLWTPGTNPKGSYVSVGIRKQGRQKNGHGYSLLYAYGFFYETAWLWPPAFVDSYADRAVSTYWDFLSDGTLPGSFQDSDGLVLLRNANLSAPVARRTNAHLALPAVKKLKPTAMAEKSIAALNRQMELAIETEETDMWGEPITEHQPEEVDPLS